MAYVKKSKKQLDLDKRVQALREERVALQDKRAELFTKHIQPIDLRLRHIEEVLSKAFTPSSRC